MAMHVLTAFSISTVRRYAVDLKPNKGHLATEQSRYVHD